MLLAQDRSSVILVHNRMRDLRYHRRVNCLFADGRVESLVLQEGETFVEAVVRHRYKLARALTEEELR